MDKHRQALALLSTLGAYGVPPRALNRMVKPRGPIIPEGAVVSIEEERPLTKRDRQRLKRKAKRLEGRR